MPKKPPQQERSSDRLIKRWAGILAVVITTSTIGGAFLSAFYLRVAIYENDKKESAVQRTADQKALVEQREADKATQAKINSDLRDNQTEVRVQLGGIQKQIDGMRLESAQASARQDAKLDRIIERDTRRP